MSHHLVTLLLGSNLGNTKENITFALARIEEEIGPIILRSDILEIEAVEFVSNNIFCNIAIVIKTQFSPVILLNLLKKIEQEMGRSEDSRVTIEYTDRVIDIDIVMYEKLKFESKKLVIPHLKHIFEREFSKKLLFHLNTLKTQNMKLGLFFGLILPIVFHAQNTGTENNNYPNTFSNGSAKVVKFDNSTRRFNDWAISVGGGAALMAKGDLTSFYDKKINFGYNAYVSLDKQITHTFGASLQYAMGKSNQKGQLPGAEGIIAGVADAYTKYQQVSVLGDLNFSNLLRRVDNKSPYRWALHGYAGGGIMAYKTELIDKGISNNNPRTFPLAVDQKFELSSFFFQTGLGLKYKVSKLVDVELRSMYIMSGDDEFDGGGDLRNTGTPLINYNLINDSYSDDLLTVNLGLTFKLGKHDSHLAWHDPLQEAYYKTSVLENATDDFVVCEKGDNDNDGVCDDWDRQLDTPAGARVDGAGVALDMDLDGVIDLYDKCVTVPGSVENNGCPTGK